MPPLLPTRPSSRSWRKTFEEKHQRSASVKTGGKLPAKHNNSVDHLPHWFQPFGRLVIKLIRVFTHPVVGLGLLAIILVCSALIVYVSKDIPSPRRLTSPENFAVSTKIFDRNGILLYEIYDTENRTPIELQDLPPYVYQASIAIEDKSFYHHFGFDLVGIGRALVINLKGDEVVGGSTITQQLVKNALLTNEKSLQRKLKEAILAVITEVIYTKDDILEMYLNYISYGGTSVGIEAASQRFFGKSAKDLTLAEAALLAGLPQAPTRYSPFNSEPQTAKDRQAEVLRRMAEDGYITKLQAEEAKAQVLTYNLDQTDIKAPHFVFFVRDWLYKKYGEAKVERGGLRVYTTLDLSLQEAAQASLSAEVNSLERYRVGNGAALVLKPNTGEILAMIGSKDYFNTAQDGQVNVTLAQRQPGSSIKPIMYATAMQEKIINPGTVLLDVPTCFKVSGQKDYCPKNYDGSFKGPVTIRQSIGNSLNIPAVKTLKATGIATFIAQATRMGITSWVDPSRYGLSLTLGGGEVRMIDLAQAFAVIANQGVKVPLTPVLRVEDYQGTVLEEMKPDERKTDLATLTTFDDESTQGDAQRVMDRAPAYLVSHIMQDNNARLAAFGARSKLVIPGQVVSAKTGTTNDLKDNWTVGFTPEFLVITWVGNNDGKPMNQSLVSGITGAAPIFNDIMRYVLRDQAPVLPDKPNDVLGGPVCASGMPPTAGKSCTASANELYWKDSRPSASKIETKETWIQPETGLPPPPNQHVEGLVLQSHTFYSDPVTENYCADCARPVTPEGKVIYEQATIQ